MYDRSCGSEDGKLKLGDDKMPTPIELDNQFDHIAAHIVPSWTAGDDRNQLLLVTQYREHGGTE